MIFFTSILSNYLSRAILLSKSVCKHHPGANFIIFVYDFDELSPSLIDSLLQLLPSNFQSRISIASSLNSLPFANYFDDRYNVIEA